MNSDWQTETRKKTNVMLRLIKTNESKKTRLLSLGCRTVCVWENKEAGKAILAALSITRTKTEEKKKKPNKIQF